MNKVPTETQEAEVLATWLRMNNLPHWHIIQEAPQAKPQYWAKLKRVGWNPGFPDYFIIIPEEKSCLNRPLMLFLELKRPRPLRKDGKPSTAKGNVRQEQIEFLDMVNEFQDIGARICYGSEESIKWVSGYIK